MELHHGRTDQVHISFQPSIHWTWYIQDIHPVASHLVRILLSINIPWYPSHMNPSGRITKQLVNLIDCSLVIYSCLGQSSAPPLAFNLTKCFLFLCENFPDVDPVMIIEWLKYKRYYTIIFVFNNCYLLRLWVDGYSSLFTLHYSMCYI